MKKLLLLTLLALLPLAASAARPVKAVSKSELNSVISEFRGCDGVEVVKLNRLATAAVKGVIRKVGKSDPEIRQALQSVRGLKKLTILEYEDAAPEIRYRINSRIAQALEGSELLMEAKDGHSSMQMFGIVDENAETVRDFVIHAPHDYALICLFGSLPMDTLTKMMAE